MNLQRISAIVVKEWREIVRDRLFFALAFVVPATLTLLFGFGLSLDVENVPLAVVDYDRSALSREYAHRFSDSRYFDFKGQLSDLREADALLMRGQVRAVVVIPEHFEQRLLSGRPAEVQTLVDGTFPFRSLTSKGYITAINASFSAGVLATAIAQTRGVSVEDAAAALQPVPVEVRYLYNQSVKSVWSIAPKLLMAIMMISPPFLTALGIVREKESGSIFNIYSSTVTRGEFLVGKLAPYVGISFLNVLILWVLACFVFGAPFKGNALFFALTALLYVICTTGIGLLVSVAVRTQVAAMLGTAILTIVPAVLYSGILIPISSLSSVATVIAHLLPGMYFANITVGSFLKDVDLGELWPDVLALALYATVLFAAGYRLFHKRTAT
ncbi:ABC transporter permease [Solimonas flava]|uniref:ABC transporter permease n=1 Tax=Solimonas flava TaxID=415849 RepID=UPI000487B6F2|nr:ABC transporter permease [Solimonas flava]